MSGELTFAQREAVAAHRGEIDDLLAELAARRPNGGSGIDAYRAIERELQTLRNDLQPSDRIDLARAIQQCGRMQKACAIYRTQTVREIVAFIKIRMLVYRASGVVDKLRGDLEQIDEAVAEPA